MRKVCMVAYDSTTSYSATRPHRKRPFVSIPQSAAASPTLTIPTATALLRPAAVDRHRIVWPYAITVGIYHLVALLALLPWFFSWTGVVLVVLGLYVFGTLGINLCYHRLLPHRGLVCPKWLEYAFAILAVCSMQD